MRIARALLASALALVLAGCGSADPEQGSEDVAGEPAAGFTVTREDGSTYRLVSFVATCPDLPAGDPDAGFVHGFASSAGTTVDPTASELPDGPVAVVRVKDGVADGTRVELPHSEEYGAEVDGISFFVLDGDNEASSGEDDAAGWLEVLHASCEPTPVLEVRIEATLGSEVSDAATLSVDGTARLG